MATRGYDKLKGSFFHNVFVVIDVGNVDGLRGQAEMNVVYTC